MGCSTHKKRNNFAAAALAAKIKPLKVGEAKICCRLLLFLSLGFKRDVRSGLGHKSVGPTEDRFAGT